jgi:probable phosphoglycerate mutase
MADRPLKAVYASLALRAQQTASALASHHGLSVQVLAGLHEVQLGDWDGRSDSETIKAYLQIFSRWLHGALDIRVPGGETGREVLERFIIDLGQVSERHAHGDIAIVSHGAAIRLVALHLARNLNRQHVDSGFLPYCSSVILERDFKASDSWRCVQWIGRRFTTFP